MKYDYRLLTTLFPFLISLGCGGTLKLDSNWRHQEIRVDGRQSDWRDAMTFVEDKDISVGVRNDNDFVYIAFATSDPVRKRQFMMRGLTVWLDVEGGDAKTLGIRYPRGLIRSDSELPLGRRDQESDPEALRQFAEQSLTELEIITPENEQSQRLRVTDLPGVAVKIADPIDNFFYEIRVPLGKAQSYPFAVALAPGQKLGLGFELGEIDREALRERFGNRPGRRGFGGRGSFGGRGRGGLLGGGRAQMFESFEFWTTVRLGSEDRVATKKMTH